MRQHKREATRLSARVNCNGQWDSAYIENASHGGLKLSGIRTMQVGDIAKVIAKGSVFEVEIVWTHDKTCGARFLPATCRQEIARFLRATLPPGSLSRNNHAGFREMGAGRVADTAG